MVSVAVSRNYQITLPKPIRKGIDISIGDSVLIETRGNEIILKKIKTDPILAAFGCWKEKVKEDSTTFVDKARATWKDREHD